MTPVKKETKVIKASKVFRVSREKKVTRVTKAMLVPTEQTERMVLTATTVTLLT